MTAAIGIDIGGSKAALGVVDLVTGGVTERTALPTPALADSGAPFVAALAGAVARLRQAHGPLPAGIGLCELVTPGGQPSSGWRVEWRGLDLAALAPFRLASDVRAAARAEAVFGAGRGLASFVYLNIGTGISHALVLDGLPHAGARGAALVSANGSVPSLSGAPGREVAAAPWVPEDIAGGAGVAARLSARLGRGVTVREALAMAAAGDPDAQAVLDLAADIAGHLAAQAVNWLDPQAVILGGGLGTQGGRYRDRLLAAARDGIWSPEARGLPILPAALGPDAGLIGAALAAAGLTGRPSSR